MLVKDLMTRDVSSCGPENNLAQLAKMMQNNRCGALPILDSSGRVTGIITDRDICIALGMKNIRASDVLAREASSPGCVSCSPGDLPRFSQPVIAEDFSNSANSLGVR
jgi:CBS domain-containing protein